MNRRAAQKYSRYHRWWNIVEKNLIKIAVLLFLVLYVSQMLNFIITQRGGSLLTLQIEKLEGKAISNSQTKINTGTVELTVISNSDYQNIQVYLNGDYFTSFSKKSISLTVKNNDIIEINGINNAFPAQIKVSKLTDNILGINADEIIKVNKNFVIAGRIKLK